VNKQGAAEVNASSHEVLDAKMVFSKRALVIATE
jgi:hypothetical protein